MHIFEQIQVGKLTLRNRIIFPPLTTGYENRDGSISQQSINFYKRLAEGGASYIVIGDVSPVATLSPTPKLIRDEMIPSFQQLTAAVHEHGAYIGAQIFHPEYDVDGIMELFKANKMDELRYKIHHDMEHYCNEVSVEKLHEIQQTMVNGAVRAVKAGFDVIQIHGDRLVGMLCSPLMNKRTDEYGGSLENRARFSIELVKMMKEACPNTVIEYKLSLIRTNPAMGKGGPTIEEGKMIAKWLEEAGVELFHVAQANHTDVSDTLPAMGIQPYGCFSDMAKEIKQSVSVPVSAVGRIFTPQMAENIVTSGYADLVSLGRQLLADPDWVKKAMKGENIRYCMMCNKGCTDKITGRQKVGCVMNAENGFEYIYEITASENPKKVSVIGGGVSGLEAARVLALKGHHVTLFEKDVKLGGQLNIAAIPPRKGEMNRLYQYLAKEVVRLGVNIQIGKEILQGDLLKENPDYVIVATGAKNNMIKISGSDRMNVLDAWNVLSGEQQVMRNVAVIGGGLVGAETAEFLASQGNQVCIIEMEETVAKEESTSIRPTLMKNFEKHNVQLYIKHKLKEILSNGVVCEKEDGAETFIPCDSVVMAVGAKAVHFEHEKLIEAGIQVIFVGDCGEKIADIENAIKTAYHAAYEIS